MALVGGSVTITSAGVVTGTGLAKVLADCLKPPYDAKKSYADQLATNDKAALAQAKTTLADAKANLDIVEPQYTTAHSELTDAQGQLAYAQAQYDAAVLAGDDALADTFKAQIVTYTALVRTKLGIEAPLKVQYDGATSKVERAQADVDRLTSSVDSSQDTAKKIYDELAEKANALGPAIVTYFTANAVVSLVGVTADDDGSSHWPVTKSGGTNLGIT